MESFFTCDNINEIVSLSANYTGEILSVLPAYSRQFALFQEKTNNHICDPFTTLMREFAKLRNAS